MDAGSMKRLIGAGVAVIALGGCATSSTTQTVTTTHARQTHSALSQSIAATQKFAKHFRLPTARYCQDGTCITVNCPPRSPRENWICETSSNPAARAAMKTSRSAVPPVCDVVSTLLSPGRDVISGQDNCETSTGWFAVLWYVDPGSVSCENDGAPSGTRVVPDDEYLAEPVCAFAAPGSGDAPPWAQIARALSTQDAVAAGATQRTL